MTEFGPHSRAAAAEADEQRDKLSQEVGKMESSIKEADFDLDDLSNPDIDFDKKDIEESLEQEALLITKGEIEEEIVLRKKEEEEFKKKYEETSEFLTIKEPVLDKKTKKPVIDEKTGKEKTQDVKVKEKAKEAYEKAKKQLLDLKERKTYFDNMTAKPRRRADRLLRVKEGRDEAEKRDIREAEDRLNEISNAELAQEASPEKLRELIKQENLDTMVRLVVTEFLNEAQEEKTFYSKYFSSLARPAGKSERKIGKLKDELQRTVLQVIQNTGLSPAHVQQVTELIRTELSNEVTDILDRGEQSAAQARYELEKEAGNTPQGTAGKVWKTAKGAAPGVAFYGGIGIAASSVLGPLGLLIPIGMRARNAGVAYQENERKRREIQREQGNRYLEDKDNFADLQNRILNAFSAKRKDELLDQRLNQNRELAGAFGRVDQYETSLREKLSGTSLDAAEMQNVQAMIHGGRIKEAYDLVQSKPVDIGVEEGKLRSALADLKYNPGTINDRVNDLHNGDLTVADLEAEFTQNGLDPASSEAIQALDGAFYLAKQQEKSRQPDYFTFLNLPRNATEQQIEQAYQQRAAQFNPADLNFNQQAHDDLVEAYVVLSDPNRRQAHVENLNALNLKFSLESKSGQAIAADMRELLASYARMEDARDDKNLQPTKDRLFKKFNDYQEVYKKSKFRLLNQYDRIMDDVINMAGHGSFEEIERFLTNEKIPPANIEQIMRLASQISDERVEQQKRQVKLAAEQQRFDGALQHLSPDPSVKSALDRVLATGSETKVAGELGKIRLDMNQERTVFTDALRSFGCDPTEITQLLDEVKAGNYPALEAALATHGIAPVDPVVRDMQERAALLHNFLNIPAETHYQALGLTETATQKQIKKAYEQLKVQHDPSAQGGGNPALLQKVEAAFAAIGSKNDRKSYDQDLGEKRSPNFDLNSRRGELMIESVRRLLYLQRGIAFADRNAQENAKQNMKQLQELWPDSVQFDFSAADIDTVVLAICNGNSLAADQVLFHQCHVTQKSYNKHFRPLLREISQERGGRTRLAEEAALKREGTLLQAKGDYINFIGQREAALRDYQASDQYRDDMDAANDKLQQVNISADVCQQFEALATMGQLKDIDARLRVPEFFDTEGVKTHFVRLQLGGDVDRNATEDAIRNFFGAEGDTIARQVVGLDPMDNRVTVDLEGLRDHFIRHIISFYERLAAPSTEGRGIVAKFETALGRHVEATGEKIETSVLAGELQQRREEYQKNHAQYTARRNELQQERDTTTLPSKQQELDKQIQALDREINTAQQRFTVIEGCETRLEQAVQAGNVITELPRVYESFRTGVLLPEEAQKVTDSLKRYLAEFNQAHAARQQKQDELAAARQVINPGQPLQPGRYSPWVEKQKAALDSAWAERGQAVQARDKTQNILQKRQDELNLTQTTIRDLEQEVQDATADRDIGRKAKAQQALIPLNRQRDVLIVERDKAQTEVDRALQNITEAANKFSEAQRELQTEQQKWINRAERDMARADERYQETAEELVPFKDTSDRLRQGQPPRNIPLMVNGSNRELGNLQHRIQLQRNAALALYKSDYRNQAYSESIDFHLLQTGEQYDFSEKYNFEQEILQAYNVNKPGRLAQKGAAVGKGLGGAARYIGLDNVANFVEGKTLWRHEQNYRSSMALLGISAASRLLKTGTGYGLSALLAGYGISKFAGHVAEERSQKARFLRRQMIAENPANANVPLPDRKLAEYERSYQDIPDIRDLNHALDEWQDVLRVTELINLQQGRSGIGFGDFRMEGLTDLLARAQELKRICQLERRGGPEFEALKEKSQALQRRLTFRNNILMEESQVGKQVEQVQTNMQSYYDSEKAFQEKKFKLQAKAGFIGIVSVAAMPQIVYGASYGVVSGLEKIGDAFSGKADAYEWPETITPPEHLDAAQEQHTDQVLEQTQQSGEMTEQGSIPEVLEERAPAAEPEMEPVQPGESVPKELEDRTDGPSTPPRIETEPGETIPSVLQDKPAETGDSSALPRGDTVRTAAATGAASQRGDFRNLERLRPEALRGGGSHAFAARQEFQVASSSHDLKGIVAGQETGATQRVAHVATEHIPSGQVAEVPADQEVIRAAAAESSPLPAGTPDERLEHYLEQVKKGDFLAKQAVYGPKNELLSVNFGQEQIVYRYEGGNTILELRDSNTDHIHGETVIGPAGKVIEERLLTTETKAGDLGGAKMQSYLDQKQYEQSADRNNPGKIWFSGKGERFYALKKEYSDGTVYEFHNGNGAIQDKIKVGAGGEYQDLPIDKTVAEEIHRITPQGEQIKNFSVQDNGEKVLNENYQLDDKGREIYREQLRKGEFQGATEYRYENDQLKWVAKYGDSRLLQSYSQLQYDKNGSLVVMSEYDRKDNPVVWDKVEAWAAGKGQPPAMRETRLSVFDPNEPGVDPISKQPLYTVEGKYGGVIGFRDNRVDAEKVTWRSGAVTERKIEYDGKDARANEIKEDLKLPGSNEKLHRDVHLQEDGRSASRYFEYKVTDGKNIKVAERSYEFGPSGQRFHEVEKMYDTAGKDVVGEKHLFYDRNGGIQGQTTVRLDGQGNPSETARTTYGTDAEGHRYAARYEFAPNRPGVINSVEVQTLNEKGEVVSSKQLETMAEMRGFLDREDVYQNGRIAVDRQGTENPIRYEYDKQGRPENMYILDSKTGATATHWEVERDKKSGVIEKYVETRYSNGGKTENVVEYDKNGKGTYGYIQQQKPNGTWAIDERSRWTEKNRPASQLPKIDSKKFDPYDPLKPKGDRTLWTKE